MHSHIKMELPHLSTHIESAMEERICQVITASISRLWESPQRKIWLWSSCFVSTAVPYMQVTADSSMLAPSFFLLPLDTPCPNFIIHPSFTLSTHPSLLRCFCSPHHSDSFYNLISNLKCTYISMASIFQYFSPPSIFMHRWFPCSSVIEKWIVLLSCLQHWYSVAMTAPVQVCRSKDNGCVDIGKCIVLWSGVRLNLWFWLVCEKQ